MQSRSVITAVVLLVFGAAIQSAAQTITPGVGARLANTKKELGTLAKGPKGPNPNTDAAGLVLSFDGGIQSYAAVCKNASSDEALGEFGAQKQKDLVDVCADHTGDDLTKDPAKSDIATILKEPNKPTGHMPSCADLKDAVMLKSYGTPKAVALRTVCVAKDSNTTSAFNDGLAEVIKIIDGSNYPDAIAQLTTTQPDASKPLAALAWAAVNAKPQVKTTKCEAYYDGSAKQLQYGFKTLAPATSAESDCGDGGVQGFFNAAKQTSFGTAVQYLYNPDLGTNQYSSDLLTSTFAPGFQLVLAGTATTGNPKTTTNSGTSTTAMASRRAAAAPATNAASTDDPVTAATQKLEGGGDFNLRLSYPFVNIPAGATSWTSYVVPSLGFNLSNTTGKSTSTGAQQGISSTDQFMFYLPAESYFSTRSIAGDTAVGTVSAAFFMDIRAGEEFVSSGLQQSLALKKENFFLGQASAGVDFGTFRIGMQYFYGPDQAYTLADSSGNSTAVKTKMKGFHVVFAYSPSKKSN
jgi:hypothetical protein